MLNSSDSHTFLSIQLLKQTVADERPITFWIGAGASRWAGYESWKDLARRMRSHFLRIQPEFDNERAKEYIADGRFPDLFQLCKESSRTTYRHFLAEALRARPVPAIYDRFLSQLRRVDRLFLVTTNADEILERNVTSPVLIQRSDISRVAGKLLERSPFICKLHGSISNIDSLIFAEEDYLLLLRDSAYIAAVKNIFTNSSVVFLGYGVQDQYVLKLLNENIADQALFGAGPHFIVTSNEGPILENLHAIRYRVDRHADHSAAMTVLDVIHQIHENPQRATTSGTNAKVAGSQPNAETAYYISDFIPPGTWSTSQTITAVGQQGGNEVRAILGLGFTNDEVPYRVSTAFHDFVVALTCFDRVYLPLNSLAKLPRSLGDILITRLLQNTILKFLHFPEELCVFFKKDELFGSLDNLALRAGETCIEVGDLIRRYLIPIPGQEKAAENLFRLIEEHTIVHSKGIADVPWLARDALLMPQIPKLLGIGDAIGPNRVPQWLAYSYLRLGHLVHTAVICSELGIQAAKLPYGGEILTTAAFNVSIGASTADEAASYAISGRYNTDLGAFVEHNPGTIDRILDFRATQSGEQLRSEIRKALLANSAFEFTASVNSGLSRTIPTSVLQKANDQMSTLLIGSAQLTTTPAVWTNEWQPDSVTRRWRDKSRGILLQLCASRQITKDDLCPCTSGDRLKDCCLRPLHT
jgi:SIR2-like domain